MALRFAKVSEEEIEEAFFYPSDLASRLGIYPPLSTSPSGDSCIILRPMYFFSCRRCSQMKKQ